MDSWIIVDGDSGRRLSIRAYADRDDAERERNRLAIRWGKVWCLEVWPLRDIKSKHDGDR